LNKIPVTTWQIYIRAVEIKKWRQG